MTRKTVLQQIIPTCVLVVVVIFNVVLVSVLSRHGEILTGARDANSYISIGEIYNNPVNMQMLYDILKEDRNTKYEKIKSYAATMCTAETLRSKNYCKTNTQNIQVTFGGLAWQVCCLSLTGNDGDADRTPILTLLLADTNILSRYQTWRIINDFDAAYPSNLYGTSYMRAVTLNNGGQYATGRDTLASATQNVNNPFAIFTMDGIVGSVTDAIIKPSQVAWQQTQSAPVIGTNQYNYFNEAWGVPSNESLNEFTAVNFRDKALNDAWKDDYLWLPSFTEIGENNRPGIWQLDDTQRRCGKQYWLRSVYQDDTYGVAQITPQGKFEYGIVNNGGYYVLPALHLNLAAASLRAASTPLSQVKN